MSDSKVNSETEPNKKEDFKDIIKQISLTFRKNSVNYSQSKYILQEVRRINKLKAEKDHKVKLPFIPSVEEKEALLELAKNNFIHWLVIKLFLTTGLRVSELINIKCMDIFLKEKKIYVKNGKGGDGYVLFPNELEMHLSKIVGDNRGEDYLIVSRLYKPYTRQGVWKFIKKYIDKLGTTKNISTHTLRHYFITRVSEEMSDSQAQLLSRHSSKKSLQIYQHLGIEKARDKYELAIKN